MDEKWILAEVQLPNPAPPQEGIAAHAPAAHAPPSPAPTTTPPKPTAIKRPQVSEET